MTTSPSTRFFQDFSGPQSRASRKQCAYLLGGPLDVLAIKQLGIIASTTAEEVCGSGVEDTQAHDLANDLRMNCMFGQARQTKHGVFGNAILSRFPLTREQELELPRGSLTRDDGSRMPGQNERRLALAAIVSPFRDAEAFDFMCICTHVGIYNTA